MRKNSDSMLYRVRKMNATVFGLAVFETERAISKRVKRALSSAPVPLFSSALLMAFSNLKSLISNSYFDGFYIFKISRKKEHDTRNTIRYAYFFVSLLFSKYSRTRYNTEDTFCIRDWKRKKLKLNKNFFI